MTKKDKQRKYLTSSKKLRIIEDHSLRNASELCPTNLQEQKQQFLKYGKTPSFEHHDIGALEEITSKRKGQIRFDLLSEAEYVLETVRSKYGTGESYLAAAYGKRITRLQASEIVSSYLEDQTLSDTITLIWCDDMPCSARMVWEGPMVRCNRPEARKFTLWINGSMENPYVREKGISCLMDHEIGTHFFRMYNDGLQPWFSDRKKFGLRGMSAWEVTNTEEGLASINTTLRANRNYLWLYALVYYTACKSAEMTFKELFDHLSRYVSNREQRWKHVMRVKRGLVDPNDLGGYGKDQCYFEGAVQLLRDVDNIDFHLLMSGKICADEVARIKRVVRKDILQIPSFMKNLEQYKQKLRQMATLNGLHLSHVKKLPPPAYVLRLKQRRNRVGVEGASPSESKRRKVRKRKKRKSSRGSSNKQCKLKVFLPEVTSQGRQDRKNGVSVSLQSNKADDSAAKCKTDLPQVTSAGARRPSSLTQLTSSFSDIRACHGFRAFPVRQPLPPIGTPQEEMAYLSPELDESDSSRHSISLSSLNLEAFLFPVDPIPDPVAQNTLKVLHQEEHSSDDSDDVTTSDDSQEEEEDIF